jgi:hypothetical protein
MTEHEHRYAVGRWDADQSAEWFDTMEEVRAYQETLDPVALAAGEYYLEDILDEEDDAVEDELLVQVVGVVSVEGTVVVFEGIHDERRVTFGADHRPAQDIIRALQTQREGVPALVPAWAFLPVGGFPAHQAAYDRAAPALLAKLFPGGDQ